MKSKFFLIILITIFSILLIYNLAFAKSSKSIISIEIYFNKSEYNTVKEDVLQRNSNYLSQIKDNGVRYSVNENEDIIIMSLYKVYDSMYEIDLNDFFLTETTYTSFINHKLIFFTKTEFNSYVNLLSDNREGYMNFNDEFAPNNIIVNIKLAEKTIKDNSDKNERYQNSYTWFLTPGESDEIIFSFLKFEKEAIYFSILLVSILILVIKKIK